MSQLLGSDWEKITGSQQLVSGGGVVSGFIVNSHTNGTIKLWDSLTATGEVIVDTITLAAGPQVFTFPQPLNFQTGLFATIGGTVDITVVFNKTS